MKAIHKLNRLSLKDLDSAGLLLVLQKEVMLQSEIFDYDNVHDAASLATFLHRNGTRGNRGKLETTPYIEHPLRNTIRLLRWKCWSENVIIASLLHDVIEDCSDEILSLFLNKDPQLFTEKERRSMAISFLKDEFNADIAHLVLAVSNDIPTGKVTLEQKRENYLVHVKSVIYNPEVFVVKMSDFVDNASGLYHNNIPVVNADGSESPNMKVINRAKKYLPVVDVFEEAFDAINHLLPVSDDAKEDIQAILTLTRSRLEKIIAGH